MNCNINSEGGELSGAAALANNQVRLRIGKDLGHGGEGGGGLELKEWPTARLGIELGLDSVLGLCRSKPSKTQSWDHAGLNPALSLNTETGPLLVSQLAKASQRTVWASASPSRTRMRPGSS